MQTLKQLFSDDWVSRLKKHETLVGPFADHFVKRRDLKQSHPVHDFLFTYYQFSHKQLKQWVPSIEEELTVSAQTKNEYPWFSEYWFNWNQDSLSYNQHRIQENHMGLAKFVAELCENILARPPRFSCYGLHEWAMVYKLSQDQIRHHAFQLRLSPSVLANFVESQHLCCSHYDAFRFFTEEGRPLNVLNPTPETRLQMEQGGCLHVNMDLYKWSTKLWPWIGSDFIAKTFMLALKGRELDMRASPYDLIGMGYEPIYIETEDGKRQYQKEQQQLTEEATPLRQELRAFCERFLALEGRCCINNHGASVTPSQ